MATAYAEALIRRKDDARARQMLLANLGDVEKAGMKPEAATIYYLLGLAAKSHGDMDEAASYSKQAVKAVDAIRAEPGGDKVLQRADMAALYKNSTQALSAANR